MAAQTKKAKKAVGEASSKTLVGTLPWLLLIGGAVALLASTELSVEVFDKLKNPHFVPICNLNPVLSCMNVANSNQAHVFGFPNYFIGIAGYAVVATIGAVLLAGATLARWFWRLVEVGLTFAAVFVTWMQFETLYRIGALCLFCMVVWACTAPMFWYTTLYNLQAGNINIPQKLCKPLAFMRRHHGDLLLLWFLIIITLILKRFWYYWSTLI